MKPLNKKATIVFYDLLSILGDKPHVKIDNAPGAFMPVNIDRLGPCVVAIAHNFVQNGDLMADPDMQFYIHPATGQVFPYVYQFDPLAIYEESIFFDDAGQPTRFYPRLQAQHAIFASQWMLNIKVQQGPDLRPISIPAINPDNQAVSGCHQEQPR